MCTFVHHYKMLVFKIVYFVDEIAIRLTIGAIGVTISIVVVITVVLLTFGLRIENVH